MDPSSFVWDDARFFLAVYRGGSLSSAARAMRVNQSTVGRRIAALEQALGVRLFAKTPEGYEATPDGERLLPHAERMEEETLAVGRELAADRTRLPGLVRVTSSDGFGARVLTRILVELRDQHPEIDVEVIADNRLLSLGRREADISLRFARPSEALVVGRRLVDFGQALYASQAYLQRRGRPHPPDFAGHDFIGFNLPPTTPEVVWLTHAAREARIVFSTNSTFAQLEATLAGVGLAMLPCYLADPEPSLVCLLPPEQVVMRALWMVIHRDLQHSARVRACADFIVKALARMEPILSGRGVERDRTPARAPRSKPRGGRRAE
jgi:DNA-binding transcriptional LysR family regulator